MVSVQAVWLLPRRLLSAFMLPTPDSSKRLCGSIWHNDLVGDFKFIKMKNKHTMWPSGLPLGFHPVCVYIYTCVFMYIRFTHMFTKVLFVIYVYVHINITLIMHIRMWIYIFLIKHFEKQEKEQKSTQKMKTKQNKISIDMNRSWIIYNADLNCISNVCMHWYGWHRKIEKLYF